MLSKRITKKLSKNLEKMDMNCMHPFAGTNVSRIPALTLDVKNLKLRD